MPKDSFTKFSNKDTISPGGPTPSPWHGRGAPIPSECSTYSYELLVLVLERSYVTVTNVGGVQQALYAALPRGGDGNHDGLT